MSRDSHPFDRVGLSLYAVVVCVVGLSSIGSWDIWWHLRTGELVLERMSTLPVDEFSLTRSGQPWVYKDLGSEVLFALLYRVGGEWGLALFKLAAAGALGWLLWVLVRRRVETVWLAVAVAGPAFVITSFRIIVRPESATLMLLAATLVLIRRRRAATRGGGFGPSFWGLVGIHLLWVNLHRGVVLGLLLLWAVVLSDLVGALAVKRKLVPARFVAGVGQSPMGRLLPGAACALTATVASLVNPFGSRPLLMALRVTSSEALRQSVSEWASLGLGELWSEFPLASVWMALVVVCVPFAAGVSLRRRGDLSLWDLVQTILFLVAGVQAVRMLPVMAIGTAGPLAGSLGLLLGRRRAAWSGRLRPLSALAGLLVVLLAWADPSVQASRPGFARDRYPEAGVALIRSAPIAGEGFTSFTFAGYVIYFLWPGKHVICDGRFDTVYDEATMSECMAAERRPEPFEAVSQRYGLEWVLAHNQPDERRGASFAWLDSDPGWTLIHWDAASLLYVRHRGANGWLVAELGYGYLRPHDPDVSLFEALEITTEDPIGRAELGREVRRLQEAAPDDYRTHILLALFLYETGASESEEFRLVVEALRLDRDRNPEAVDQVLRWVGAAP